MSKVTFKLDKEGVRALLQSPEAMAICQSHASAIANRAGAGFEVDTFTGFDRAHAMVKPGTPEAARDNLENNTLLKAVR